MHVEKIIKETCKNAGEKLIKMYPDKDSEKLIFPTYRNKEVRVSEQEARFAFANEISKNDIEGLYYSIEVPTKKRYKDFKTKPKVFESDSKEGRSGSIDLSLYDKESIIKQKPIVNIEFKAGQPEQASITKDILKLAFEQHKFGVFFHVLKHSDGGTLGSLIDKFNEAFDAILGIDCKLLPNDLPIYFFIVVLEDMKKNLRVSKCLECHFNLFEKLELKETDFKSILS